MRQHRNSSLNSGQSGRQVPVIYFPDDWNKNGGRSSPEFEGSGFCRACSWDGDASSVFYSEREPPVVLYERTRTSRCISCQLSSAVLESCVFLAFNVAPDSKYRLDMIPCGEGDNTFEIWYKRARLRYLPTLSIFISSEISGSQGESAPLGIPQRRSEIDTSSHRTSLWAHSQISHCLQTHSGCADFTGATGTFLPTRLIELDHFRSSKDVVLIDSTDIPTNSPYVALSYCWGKDQPQCQTTRATLAERKQRIPWSSLPQTFKDAVSFTQSLHIRYLWIDGICIIQGDAADWIYESGKMFDVYRNAFVTLAAGWGDSSTSGLFSTSQGKLVAELIFKNHRWPLHAFKSHPQYGDWAMGYREWEEPSSLFKRAWTLQERLISPRVLVFTKYDLHFECFSHMACECGYTQNVLSKSFSDNDTKKQNFFKVLTSRTERADAENETNRLDVVEDLDESDSAWSDCSSFFSYYRGGSDELSIESLWRETVSDFSRLQLSFESDRLPAIGAISHQISKHRPNELYLAGLWSGSLLYDLLWHRGIEHGPWLIPERPWAHTNPGMSQDAPSWSWAFCGDVVDWWYNNHRFDLVDTNRAEIVEAKCWYKNNNSSGTLEKASMVLRSELFPCWMIRESDTPRAQDSTALRCCSGFRLRNIDCYIDMPDERYVKEQPLGVSYRVYLFFIAEGILDVTKYRAKFYLLLRSIDRQRNVFRRIGVVEWMHSLDEGKEWSAQGAVKHNSDEHERIGEETVVVSNHLVSRKRKGVGILQRVFNTDRKFQQVLEKMARRETITIM
ncbi:heterokaryon incompatibility protein-domain-containing protein [Xylaria curta]|nr:heterokaryon incompatibility protein-domain-containing protein [Xylaria curta]